MYPIAAVVLNLPPEIRYKKENMILLGLWAGKKKMIHLVYIWTPL